MGELTAFVNGFLSYLLVFIVFVITMIVAAKIGIGLRKKKDGMTGAAEADSE